MEYEIYKHYGPSGMYAAPTGLILTCRTKTEAIRIGRERLGRGTYSAKESSRHYEQRARVDTMVYNTSQSFFDEAVAREFARTLDARDFTLVDVRSKTLRSGVIKWYVYMIDMHDVSKQWKTLEG